MILKEHEVAVTSQVKSWLRQGGVTLLHHYKCEDNEKFPEAISIYFIMAYGIANSKFRISNHTEQHKDYPEQGDIRSITVGDNTSFHDIEKFVNNRIKSLKKKALYVALNKLKKSA